MSNLPLNLDKDIPESERTPLVEWLLNIIAEQQKLIDKLEAKVSKLERKVENLDEQLLIAKKLKGKPKSRPSTLNEAAEPSLEGKKRAGSEKKSEKTSFIVDEERVIEPVELPEDSKFNGYREYDVQDLMNEYSRSYLIAQQLPVSTMLKLEFSPQSLAETDIEWQNYLGQLGIKSQSGIKLLTEAALLGSAIEQGLSPEMIILSDGARQFSILVHALCWIHRERSIRRLQGVTKKQGCEIETCQKSLWEYYHQLKAYQDKPTETEKQRLTALFDDIFGKRYPRNYGLNLAMQQFCAHKQELLRVLDAPRLPLHTNAAETDIREYVTRRKISGGTRNDDGRRARDTFTGLKKTCRKLAYSFWQYLMSRLRGDNSVPYLPDVIRAKAQQVTPEVFPTRPLDFMCDSTPREVAILI